MYKKLATACIAMAALAGFLIAPSASASPVLTEGGTAVAVGSSITFKNTGNIFFTGAATLACETGDLKGTVLVNTGTRIKSEVPLGGTSFTGTGTNGDCTSSLGPFRMIMNSKLCMETITGTDTWRIIGCGSTNITFTLEFTGLGTCKYTKERLNSAYTTSADATINVSKEPYVKEEGGAFCPSEGQLDMDLDLTTTDGTTLLIS
jgi:hypothetical protein